MQTGEALPCILRGGALRSEANGSVEGVGGAFAIAARDENLAPEAEGCGGQVGGQTAELCIVFRMRGEDGEIRFGLFAAMVEAGQMPVGGGAQKANFRLVRRLGYGFIEHADTVGGLLMQIPDLPAVGGVEQLQAAMVGDAFGVSGESLFEGSECGVGLLIRSGIASGDDLEVGGARGAEASGVLLGLKRIPAGRGGRSRSGIGECCQSQQSGCLAAACCAATFHRLLFSPRRVGGSWSRRRRPGR